MGGVGGEEGGEVVTAAFERGSLSSLSESIPSPSSSSSSDESPSSSSSESDSAVRVERIVPIPRVCKVLVSSLL
jgi:hypothetical protein